VAVLIFAVQLTFNYQVTGQFDVLGYATNVSNSGLLAETNAERSVAGLGTLKLNSKLNAAAQSKAQDMVDDNYWAHDSPDGKTPWFWFDLAGYSYSKAGENLAYGFATSTDVVDGWMNSPPHRANILDSEYTEVGFGIMDGATFQGNENTVVVAMYAKPLKASTPAPAPAATQSQIQSTPTSQQEVESESDEETIATEESETQPEESEPEIVVPKQSQRFFSRFDSNTDLSITGELETGGDITSSTISNLDAIIAGEAHWSLYVTIGAISAMAFIYFIRHVTAIVQLVKHGEHYIMGHPIIEASIIYILLWLLLAGTYGVIL
jgi:uncharacterized protein YkwD